jgi:glycosyltransferase involved in cell wall biosynthesis
VVATGSLENRAVAKHLAACDLLLQPFPDGVSTRRGSVMAGIALGVPVLSNVGGNSERVWIETGAIALTGIAQMPERVKALLADSAQRESIGAAGRILYQQQFSLDRTIETLRRKLFDAAPPGGSKPSHNPICKP